MDLSKENRTRARKLASVLEIGSRVQLSTVPRPYSPTGSRLEAPITGPLGNKIWAKERRNFRVSLGAIRLRGKLFYDAQTFRADPKGTLRVSRPLIAQYFLDCYQLRPLQRCQTTKMKWTWMLLLSRSLLSSALTTPTQRAKGVQQICP